MTQLKQKPSGIYYIDVEVPCEVSPTGLKRSRISFETRDEGDAKAQRRDWLAGVHPKHPNMGGVVAPKGREAANDSSVSATKRSTDMTLELWLTKCLGTIWSARLCKSQRSLQSNVRVLSKLLPEGLLLADVTMDTYKSLVTLMRDKGYAEGTIHRKLQMLSAAMTEAVEMNETEGPPLLANKPRLPKMAPLKNKQERVISRAEEVAIFEAIDERIEREPNRPWWKFKACLTIAFDLGFRAGELTSLGAKSIRQKQWLNDSGGMSTGLFLGLERYMTKNDKPRDVPVTDRVAALIPALNAQMTKGKWFPWQSGGSGLLYLWNNIRADLEAKGFDLSDVKLHTFRHTCATRLAEGGLDLVSLRDWLGHSDIKITADRYIHLMSTHLHRGAIILNGGPMAQPKPSQADIPEECRSLNNHITGSNRADGGIPALH